MSKSKLLRLLITEGDDEEVLAILVQERYANKFGEITPPVTVEHEGREYLLKRKFMPDAYVYKLSEKKRIDDFLVSEPLK